MYNTSFLYGITGHVAEIPTPNRAIIHFELHGVLQSAFLRIHRFYKNGKHVPDNQNLNNFLKIGHKVKFSCHINDNPESGQCQWFITNCWRHIESEQKVEMLTGMMNVAGTVTDLKQRHGTLMMIDLLGIEHKVHFLGSKVYLFGKRLAASKPLPSQLQVDDIIYFDAIPCFPEENNRNCNWFATCVHKGKKPELLVYKDSSNTETADIDKEKIFNIFGEFIKGDDKTVRGKTPAIQTDHFNDGINREMDNLSINTDGSPSHFPQHRHDSNMNLFDETGLRQSKTSSEERQTSEISGHSETDFMKEDYNLKIEPSRISAQMLHDIKLLTNDPRVVFAKSEGIILDIINEEYGVILGEFQRNVFQSILFHRSNAFLFKMSLAHSKLTEIFIEGDRVQFIAVVAPKKFVCDWIATQVSVASDEQDNQEDLDDNFSEDFIE